MFTVIKKIVKTLLLKLKFRKNKSEIKSYNISSNIEIGRFCLIGKNVQISDNVKIGDFTYFNSNKNWSIIESNITIGKFCSIAPGVIIGLGNHNYHNVTTHPILYNNYYMKKMTKENKELKQTGLIDTDVQTIIGNDVWIGMNACIKRGVKIGDGAIIGMNAVVTKDVPPFAIVGGVPAKVISYRFKEEDIKLIINNPWWDWNYDDLLKNYIYLYDIEKYRDKIEGVNSGKDL